MSESERNLEQEVDELRDMLETVGRRVDQLTAAVIDMADATRKHIPQPHQATVAYLKIDAIKRDAQLRRR